MHFSDEEAALLKAWIVKRLENTSDADPDVLADYVLALLRHEGSPEDVRKLCEEEIPDFLKEESTVFLDDVFAAIAYKAFLPGAPPAPKLSQTQAPPPPPTQIPASAYYPAAPPPDAAAFAAPRGNASRKRPFRDFDDPNLQGNGERTYDGGRGKQARRQNGYPSVNSAMQGAGAPASVFEYDPMAMLDASMQAFMAQQQALGGGGMASRFQRSGRGQGSRRGRCRDYDAQGYCTRGNTCKFEHGPPTSFDLVPPPAGQFDGYDPTNAALLLPHGNSQKILPMALPQLPAFPFDGRQTQFPMENRQVRGPKSKGGRRSQLSAEGPVHDKSRSTIVVENIPEENFTEDEVKGFFSQFGAIISVSMQPYKRLAVVEYENWASANAAYRSPKVIFDNRFVRVFWRKEDDMEQLGKPARTNGNAGGANTEGTHATNGDNSDMKEEHDAEPEVDMEEFVRRQEEAQKAFDEKKRRREELDRQRQDVEQRQKELREERKKLGAKLAARGAGEPSNRGSSPEITFSTDASSSSKPESEETRALRATLAALEEEARSIGLNPEESAETSSWPPAYRGRGGYRGRGRGGSPFAPHYGTYAPRAGFRGGYRGRGRGNHHAAYAMYSLDHRPKRVAVSGVDFSTAEKDEALRQYLLGVGEFKEIQIQDGGVAHVSFSDRRTAETFYYGLASGKGIPGIEAPIELAWVPNSAAETATSSSKPSPRGEQAPGTRDAADVNDDVMTDGAREPASPRDSDRDDDDNMDYEAADDDEENWDVA